MDEINPRREGRAGSVPRTKPRGIPTFRNLVKEPDLAKKIQKCQRGREENQESVRS